MYITRLKLQNWKNFRSMDVPLHERTYLLGANASGKSNLLDAVRFLRDISKREGGGLQTAVRDRDGMKKLRCLHARKPSEVLLEVHLSRSPNDKTPEWKYLLEFTSENSGFRRVLVTKEQVWHGDEIVLDRPSKEDRKDSEMLTQTHLEQVRTNGAFREIANFFMQTTYLHLVPQLLKYSDRIAGKILENDPYGQGFLDRIAKVSEKTRASRLLRIEKALKAAVPQFEALKFEQDKGTGRPHLEALYRHHRKNAGWQREEQFSDGTLRLLALLWSLVESDTLLLLEEPELSLNDAIVKEIPAMIDRIQRDKRTKRQLIISTHSEALLSNPGIDARGVLLLEPGHEGTLVRQLSEVENNAVAAGLPISEVVLPKTRPEAVEQLALW